MGCQHLYAEESYIAPTCETEGVLTEVCSLCGDEKITTEAALGHDYITSLDTPAVCEKDGYYRARCMRCKKEVIENRPAPGHSYVTETESEDEITKVCTVCGTVTTEAKERRNLVDAFKNPLVIGVCVIVVVQAVLLTAVGIHRHSMHKTVRKTNTDINEDEEETL